MTVVEFSIPTTAFELGAILHPPPGLEIELVEFVPMNEGPIPYLWIEGDTNLYRQFERRVRANDRVNGFWSVGAQDGRRLVRLDWEHQSDEFLKICFDEEVMIQRGVGDHERWRFQLRFADRAAATGFQQRCVDANIPVTVLRLSNPGSDEEAERYGLTDAQREALLLARDAGYFGDPRGTTLAELGEQLGITRQAVSYRIRAGVRHLIDATLRAESTDR